MRSSMELKSKLLISSAGLWVPITELWTGALKMKLVIGVASCDLPSTSSTPFATPVAVMFTTAQALVSFSRRFRPPRYRAALIHLSASSRLSGPGLLPVGVRSRFGDRRVERFANHTPHNEETGDADEGSEPEGGEPYHEGQGYRESAREPGYGGEQPRHPRLSGTEPTRQHGRGAGERADHEDEDDYQERLPRPNA